MAEVIDSATTAKIDKDLETARRLVAAGALDAAAVTIRTALERALFSVTKAKGLWAEACTDRDGTVYANPKPSRAIYVLGTHKAISNSDRKMLQGVNKVGNAGAHAGSNVSRDEVLKALHAMEAFVKGNAATVVASARPAVTPSPAPAYRGGAAPTVATAAKPPAVPKSNSSYATSAHRRPVAAAALFRTANAGKKAVSPMQNICKSSERNAKAKKQRKPMDVISMCTWFAIAAMWFFFSDWIVGALPGFQSLVYVCQGLFTDLIGDGEAGRIVGFALIYVLYFLTAFSIVCSLLEKLDDHINKKASRVWHGASYVRVGGLPS